MTSENIKNREKYLNWLSLIETDYITMFIKTWFTFLASIKELVNNTSEGTIGDGKVVEEYKDILFDKIPIQIDEEFIKNVFRAYLIGKNNALNTDVFLKDYFEIFYSYNEKYSQDFTYTYKGKTTKLSLKFHRNRKKNYLKITLTDERQLFKNYFGETIETGFSLSEKVKNSKIFEEKKKFIEEVLSAIKNKAHNIVNDKHSLDDRGRRERISFLENKCLIDIERKLNENFDIKSVFRLRPDNTIASLNPNTLEISDKTQLFDENLTEWFIDFAYKLRNILFHFIIDPMDENWKSLFKHTYLALKHLTQENIKLLQNRGITNDNRNS